MEIMDKIRKGAMYVAIPLALAAGYVAGTHYEQKQDLLRHAEDNITLTITAQDDAEDSRDVSLDAKIGGQTVHLDHIEDFVYLDRAHTVRIGSRQEGTLEISDKGAGRNNWTKKGWVDDCVEEIVNEHTDWQGKLSMDDGTYGDVGCAGGVIGPVQTTIVYHLQQE